MPLFFFAHGLKDAPKSDPFDLAADLCAESGGTLVYQDQEFSFLSLASDLHSPIDQTFQLYDALRARLGREDIKSGLWLSDEISVSELQDTEKGKGPQIFWSAQEKAQHGEDARLKQGAQNYGSRNTWPLVTQPIESQKTGAYLYQEVLSARTPGPGDTASFVAQLETEGQIGELDSHVLRRALSALEADPDLRLGINLSRASLSDPMWVKALATPASPQCFNRLYIELTETAFVPGQGETELQEACQAIKARGAHLVLDDLGKGATSLQELRSLPLDYVKLDRDLVTWLIENPSDYDLIADLRALGKEQGWQLIGEGAEDASTIDFLTGHGVSFVQGFAIQRPELSTI